LLKKKSAFIRLDKEYVITLNSWLAKILISKHNLDLVRFKFILNDHLW